MQLLYKFNNINWWIYP